MGIVLLFFAQTGAAHQKSGGAVMVGASSASNALVWAETGRGVASFVASGATTATAVPAVSKYPTLSYQIAFTSPPLADQPAWVNLGDRVRSLGTTRGRSYEFDRMETGTMRSVLDNRDSALSPDNSGSPYAPIKSTRPVRAILNWDQPYPLFRGISDGYPQAYPHVGADALVDLPAGDLFYGINNSRFTTGQTSLTVPLQIVPAATEETITVSSTALPMPQVTPFEIIVDEGITGREETMTVTAILGPTSYRVTRGESPQEHLLPSEANAPITTRVFSIGEQMAGERIRTVLDHLGYPAGILDLDAGRSLMTATEDLAATNPLEHINLIAEADFGRFFVSADGKFTYRDRQSLYVDHLTPDITFSTSDVPYSLDGALEHSDEKLYNRVKITIRGGNYDGLVVDVSDPASITEHFERVYERTFPYANPNDATAAAQYVLSHSAETTVRVPGIVVQGVKNPSTLWPQILSREIGDRARFRYQPQGGGTEIDRQLVVDGISHAIQPERHAVTFRCTEVSDLDYWILGRAGYTELGSTTRLGF